MLYRYNIIVVQYIAGRIAIFFSIGHVSKICHDQKFEKFEARRLKCSFLNIFWEEADLLENLSI